MKTQTYRGTLVDAACATPGASASATTTDTTSNQSSTTPSGTGASTPTTGGADRSGGSDASCSISASTTQFALKMQDGRTVRFDSVGNDRTQLAMKDSKKKWTEAKPARVKVSGVMSGDKLTVMSIN